MPTTTKDTVRMPAVQAATLRTHGAIMQSQHQPDPTPASPLEVPEDVRRITEQMRSYDEEWSGLSTDSERLSHLNDKVRSLTVEQMVSRAHFDRRLDAIETEVSAIRTDLEGLRADVRGLSTEVAALVSVLKATAGRQVETQHKIEEVEEEMEQSQERISQLSEAVAHTQSEVADVTAEVVQIGVEVDGVRPKLDSVRDIHEVASTAAAEAMAARQQGEQTAAEVKALKTWRYVVKGASWAAAISTYEVVKHYALDILKAIAGH